MARGISKLAKILNRSARRKREHAEWEVSHAAHIKKLWPEASTESRDGRGSE